MGRDALKWCLYAAVVLPLFSACTLVQCSGGSGVTWETGASTTTVGGQRISGRDGGSGGRGIQRRKKESGLLGLELGQVFIVIVRGVFLSTRHDTQPSSVALMLRDSWKSHVREERMTK